MKAQPYLQSLHIPTQVADERISGKLLQLDPPEGKVSDQRKAELAVIESEREKKRVKRAREGDCGLAGRRKRKLMGKDAVGSIKFVSRTLQLSPITADMSSCGQLCCGTASPPPLARVHDGTPRTSHRNPFLSSLSLDSFTPTSTTHLFPTPHLPIAYRNTTGSRSRAISERRQYSDETSQSRIRWVCLVRYARLSPFMCSNSETNEESNSITVKRAKNPSLVGLKGIVLQETQGTFKIVTPKSLVKGTSLFY